MFLHLSITYWFVDFGIQFPTDRSDDPLLIKCVIHGGSDKVPWTHVVGTHDGRMMTDRPSNLHI